MANRQSLTYVEIDIPEFGLSSPGAERTLRFSIDTGYLPREIEAVPSIRDVTLTPAIISLGENLGQRATLKVTFRDHKHIFDGEDFDSGTFWGKFRARYGLKLRGRDIRLIRGFVGDDIADMETHHYVIESSDGPTADGEYTLVGKDVLKLADGDRAQAPALSNGFLAADINAAVTTATLSPAGIGNAEYPASGYVAIGGKEIVSFTRAADVLTITRAQLGTVASTHTAQDRVQLCLRYSGVDAANIIADLFETYADIPSAYIPIDAWLNETENFNDRLYTATIAEPTSVNTLVSELVEQAGLAIWWDDVEQLIRLQVLRAIGTTADTFDESYIMEDSLDVTEQPERRISQVWTYFGKINPLVKQDQIDNYRSTAATVDDDAEIDYGGPAIKKIYSRWIPEGGRATALRINDIQIGRFRDPPRRIKFNLMRESGKTAMVGGGYQLSCARCFQDETGAAVDVPIQVTRHNPQAAIGEFEAEEMLFQAFEGDSTDRVVIFDTSTNNVNLRTTHDTLYAPPESGDVVICIVQAGVIIGSSSTGLNAFDVGSWPAGVSVTLIVEGRIQGAGGAGGRAFIIPEHPTGYPGSAGGVALYTRYAIDLDVSAGAIFGGAGGGGGSASSSGGGIGLPGGGGGGGAGTVSGIGGGGAAGGTDGSPGTADAGGAGGSLYGGAGGNPGSAASMGGSPGAYSGGAGGAHGSAIDGVSYVTVTAGPGDIRGPQVN